MSDPIRHLLQEHTHIMEQIAELRAALRDLSARRDAAVPDALPVFRRIGQMMETQLATHARKEDDALFPAIESMLGADGSPTGVMRMEHTHIHAQGELLRNTLHELNQIEHPQIEASGEQLRVLSVQGGDVAALRATAEEIITLLDAHFDKEEHILFPMAESLLDAQTLADVAAKMEAIR